MAAKAMADLSRAVDAAVDRLDVQHLRPRQKRAFQCSAACCDGARGREEFQVRSRSPTRPGPAADTIAAPFGRRQACLQRCTEPVLKGERAVTAGMGRMQEHLTRCTGRCEDLARQALPAGAGESQIARAQAQLEACVAKCAAEQAGQVRPPPRGPSLAAAVVTPGGGTADALIPALLLRLLRPGAQIPKVVRDIEYQLR